MIAQKIGKCINPHCRGVRLYARGLCCGCYKLAGDHVRERRTTWADMEKRGKVLPVALTPMGKRRIWFIQSK